MTSTATEQWYDTFSEQLRLHGWPEHRIRDAQHTIASHCHDAHQDPTEAFGEPVTYAAELAGLTTRRWSFYARRTLPQLAGLLGVILLFSPDLHDGRPTITLTWAAVAAVTCAIVLAPFLVPRLLHLRHVSGLDSAIRITWFLSALLGFLVYKSIPGTITQLPALLGWIVAIALVYIAALTTPMAPPPTSRFSPRAWALVGTTAVLVFAIGSVLV